jgi:transcription initiation factor IIE alpha subunit
MKQYKLTAWPDLPPRYRSTAMHRVVSEMTQRFVTARDLARKSGASTRDIEELLAKLSKDGVVMSREAPRTLRTQTSWRDWATVVRGLVRTIRRQEAR